MSDDAMNSTLSYYTLQPSSSQLLASIPADHEVTVKRESVAVANRCFVRDNRMLLIYELNGDKWTQVHKEPELFSFAYATENYPWEVYDGGLLVVRKIEGVVVYRWANGKLEQVLVISEYHDAYGYDALDSSVVLGKFFVSDKYIGVVSRLQSTVQFRSIDLTNVGKPLQALLHPPKLGVEWTKPSSRITLIEHVDDKPQLTIALRTESELQLFRFNEQYELKLLTTVLEFPPISQDYDRIVFAKFDNTKYNDLLHFSNDGLMMYRYNETMSSFEKVYYSTVFSKLRGWTDQTVKTISTIDVDGDGMDELFASGPLGLCLYMPTFTNDGFELANVFNPSITDLSLRYGLPKLAAKAVGNANGHNVLLYTGEQLLNVKVHSYQPETTVIPTSEVNPAVTPSPAVPLLVPQSKYFLWLHDQMDLTTILQPLNPHAGTVELSIPLIELQNPFGVSVRKTVQYKNIPYEGVLGKGWSLPLDYITVERKGSAFRQDYQYAIVKNNNRILLRARPEWDMAWRRYFQVDGYRHARIFYHEKQNRWEVMMQDRTFVYGTWEKFKTFSQEMVCSTWPLCGPKSNKTQHLPTKWYLVHEQNEAGHHANYYYDPLDGGLRYRLASIRLDNEHSVTLKYGQDGRLSNFALSTSAYDQRVAFGYEGNRLTSIKQEDKPLFAFEYKNERIAKITYPNGLQSSLEYEDIIIDRTRSEEVVSVDENPTIYYGPDYTAILCNSDEGGTDHKVLTVRTLLGGTDSEKVMVEKLHLGKPNIKNQMVHALENLLVVVLIYETHKDVTVLQHVKGKWTEKKRYDAFPLLGTIGAGKRFVVLYDLKTIQALTIKGQRGQLDVNTVHTVTNTNFLIREFVNGFVTYDETGTLTVWLIKEDSRWIRGRMTPELAIYMEIERFVSMFDLSAEFREALRKGLRADAITMHQNAVVLRAPVLVDQKLTVAVHILTVDFTGTAPYVCDKKVANIPVADFRTYEYEMRTKDGDLFKLGYKPQGRTLQLSVRSSKGPLMHSLEEQRKKAYREIDGSRESDSSKKKYRQDVDKSLQDETNKIYRTVVEKVQFAMDLSQFGVLSNVNGILTANTQLTFDGVTWVQKRVGEQTMRLEHVNELLSDGYRLVRNGRYDTFKIHDVRQNSTIFDTQTTNPNELQIVAPRYVQAQRRQQPLRVFFFKSREVFTFPARDKLNRASNSIALVMVRTRGAASRYVIFRPVDSFLLKQTTVFSRQTVRLNGEESRVTSYLFDAADAHLSSEGATFHRTRIVPGGNSTRFGWHEQSTDMKSGKTTEKSFSGDGREVTVREKKTTNEESTNANKDTVIWDRSGQLKIVDLGPISVADQTVAYYGFEQYELNQYGNPKANLSWAFNERDVYFEHENHYLKLPYGQSLKGTLRPKDPLSVFLVTCWVRVAGQPVGDSIDIVRVDVINEVDKSKQSFSGAKVHYPIQNWHYIETIIDTTKYAPGAKLQLHITFQPTASYKTIDVDHIRFSPLDFNFRANIYTPVMADLRAVLSNNGLPRQSLYSPRSKRVLLLSEHGQIMDFSMHTKIVVAEALGAMQSLVELKPHRGVYDSFQQSDWTTSKPKDWTFRHGVLSYKNDAAGEIVRTFTGPFRTLALRFLYHLKSNGGRLSFNWNSLAVDITCHRCPGLPEVGEVFIFVTPKRVSVWLEGCLMSETLLPSSGTSGDTGVLRLRPTGTFTFTEFAVMYDSRVKVTYHNRMGRPVQIIEYEDPSTVRIREILYDEIDRPTMQTKWTKLVSRGKEFFAFRQDFVTSIGQTSGRMAGRVAEANPSCDGYPFSQTIYANDPTENKQLQGLPGQDYTIHGKYRRRYSMKPEVALLRILFPESEGFRQRIVERPGGAIRAKVEDLRGNKVAKYWKVGNYEDRLTTYKYDSEGRLVRELPPQFHALAGTCSSRVSLFNVNWTSEIIKLRNKWMVEQIYDENHMLTKQTPDGGLYEYVYNEQGILRFSMHFDASKKLDRVIHFSYASNGKVTREALVNLDRKQCYDSVESFDVPESNDLIESVYGELDLNPMVRYRSQQSTRRIGENRMMESLIFDENERLIKKVFIVPTINTTYSIDYEWENGVLQAIRYPIDSAVGPLELRYEYGGNGEVSAIRHSIKKHPMFEFTYNADRVIERMTVEPGSDRSFTRNFTYNEPGFLVQIDDPFLSERISYLETDSYGQDSYTPIYEGLISQTFFTAHWQPTVGALRNGIFPEYFVNELLNSKQAAVCFEALQRAGYLQNNQVNRTLYAERDDELPHICGDRIPLNHLAGVLSGRSFPLEYGHRYDYDDHDQMMKAKYFHGKDEHKLTPLTHKSFGREITGLSEQNSKTIWDALTSNEFLTTDCTNPSLCHGRPGMRSLFKTFVHQHRFSQQLEIMLSRAIADRAGLSEQDFERKCDRWIEASHMVKARCEEAKALLKQHGVLGSTAESPLQALQEEFGNALKAFRQHIPDIVRVLTHHFATGLGRSAGDVQSYEIDANGNHRMFYTGFTRYRMEYREGTNQITKVHRLSFDQFQDKEQSFEMEHNSDGAVVKAEHKGIKHMEYDRILHRVSKIEMMDGRKLNFQYDVRGERTFKQVLDAEGSVTHEKYYIRDAHGIVLVDMEMTYLASDQPPDVRVTSYVYKDQQLIGFVRNDQLYSVITDHEGSVRLVVKDGEVVAAYDYLPYGQIFRRYGTDFDGQISYLYTGQEWDEDIELYNYRARLYDPDIGRFYQMDPKEQYASPYVYAGNSPVSLVDPDGEFAFALAVFIMAIVGAYLGAASANQCWNPLKWDWRSSSTWLGMLTGAVTGASIPFNLASSVAFFVGLGLSLSTSISIMIGAGITFAYFTIAATSGTWDPTKFDFTSPSTWNALMNGVATSSWILMNPSSLLSSFATLTTVTAKALFFVSKMVMSLGFTYLFAAMSQGGEFDVTKWDFSDPQLYMSIVDGFTTATVGLLFARNIPKQISKWSGKFKRSFDAIVANTISYRAHMVLGRDWASKIIYTKNFLYVNFRNTQTLQKGFLTVGFYSLIVSLRFSAISSSTIPAYSAVESTINVLFTTEQFTDFIVKPLAPASSRLMLPKPPSLGRIASFRFKPMEITLNDSMATSAASSLAGILETLRLPFDWLFGDAPAMPKTDGVPSDSKVSFPTKAPRKQERSSYTLRNCYRMHDEQHAEGVIKCFGDRTIVSIAPKYEPLDAVREGVDHFKYCVPVTYEGHPSVSCDGEWSSLVYTPHETARLFDFVDGWLLLAQVAPSAYRDIKAGIRYLFSKPQTKHSLDAESVLEQVQSISSKIAYLHSLIGKDNAEAMRWARWSLEDLVEDLESYKTKGKGSYAILADRIEALEQEISETITIRRQQQSKEESRLEKKVLRADALENDLTSLLSQQGGLLNLLHNNLGNVASFLNFGGFSLK
ncbi:uncharacterized protein LOC126573179 [Anopheles aquasalis]|uniref:uncharacterized protein LOC126573179 n=1 Tax=Anopheles aquasalis TaxID=42839 RepID=UPI00215B4E95|nr:uncharacterized protein LOC126573179 [Anopheles aquasalis]